MDEKYSEKRVEPAAIVNIVIPMVVQGMYPTVDCSQPSLNCPMYNQWEGRVRGGSTVKHGPKSMDARTV